MQLKQAVLKCCIAQIHTSVSFPPIMYSLAGQLVKLPCASGWEHRQYRFQNGLEMGSRARIKSTQTVAYFVEVWG